MSETGRTCPLCGKPRIAEHSPFCSGRCRDRDLVRWFSDAYALGGRPAEPDEISRELNPDQHD